MNATTTTAATAGKSEFMLIFRDTQIENRLMRPLGVEHFPISP